jgi:hypothetical protein
MARAFREQNAAEVETFLAGAAERWNNGIEEILQVHLTTPPPSERLEFTKQSFALSRPDAFAPRKSGVLGFFWPPFRRRVAAENEQRLSEWNHEQEKWERQRQEHEEDEAALKKDYEEGRFFDTESMERVLSSRLSQLRWPRETEVSFQVRDGGSACWLDVDLPEVEDIPTACATPASRGMKLNVRKKSDAQLRREYAQHVHGVLFRIIGEVFHCLPTVEQVVASGYSQRPDPTTGHVRDDYLISLRVQRERWSELNFRSLDSLDVVACFEPMELRRKMTKTGHFSPIVPHVEGEE